MTITSTDEDLTASAVALTAAPAAFEAAVARMVGETPTLTDISHVLHVLGGNSVTFEVDPMRTQALCHLASRALGMFSADVRCAPADELAAVVADARQDCANAHQGCQEYVLPWIFNGRHCSPTCEIEDGRTRP